MEALAVIAVFAVIALIIGFSKSTIIFAALALIGLTFVFITLFFIYFMIRLLLSRPKKGEFSRISKSPFNRFNSAYYTIDGKEYPNVFPSEGIKENRLYKEGKMYRLMLDRRGKYVFDRFSMTTCIVGFLFCTAVTAGALIVFFTDRQLF